MTELSEDKRKILVHLAMRCCWITREEIDSAWKFIDLDGSLEALEKSGAIAKLHDEYRITSEGESALLADREKRTRRLNDEKHNEVHNRPVGD